MSDSAQYAVLEWDTGDNTDTTRVIATHQSKDNADQIVKNSPGHYEREAITMDEYQKLREVEEELYR